MDLRAAAGRVVGGVAGMRIGPHRRLDVALLLVGALLVGGAAAIGAVVGDGERVTGLWAGAVIGSDGRAGIVEVIDYDFGTKQRHGIFRDVPGLSPDAQVVVSSATAPSDMTLENLGSAVRIRIGDPGRTITDRHRYKISYPLDNVAPQGRLVWDAVGTQWPVGIGNVEVHVVAPFRFEEARCMQGEAGAQRPCDFTQPEPGHLVATIRTLGAGQGATLSATGGRRLEVAPRLLVPSSGLPADATSGAPLAGLVAAAAALAGAILVSWLVRRAGREHVARGGPADAAGPDPNGEVGVDAAKLGSLATVEPSPPTELTAAQGGVLQAESVRQNHKVAWLMGAAVDGYLDIVGDERQVILERLPRQDGSATARLLDTAFPVSSTSLTLGSYNPLFATAWRGIGDELAAWQQTSGLWDPAGDLQRRLARLLGGVVAVGGLVIAGVGGALANRSGWVWLALLVWGALLAGAGLAAVVRAWELRVRTPLGSALWLRVESFRRFLAASETRHVEEAAERGVLSDYAAWAVALGEIDRWSRLVAASARCACDPVGTRYSSIAPWLPLAALASTLVPRSSSTGSRYWGWSGGDSGWSGGDSGWSGGGGDSGGGGGGGESGGGGGGSW
jgi:Predicted membrane protein (DUF2207)